MNLLEAVSAGFADLKATLASRATLETDLATARADLAEVTTGLKAARTGLDAAAKTLDAAQTELAALKTQLAAKDTEIAALKAEVKTVGEKAAALVAAQGIPIASVPGATDGAANGESLDSIRAQIKNEKDPKRRWELGLKARALRGHADLFSS